MEAVEESGEPPLKDGGNVVSTVNSKLTEDPDNSEDNVNDSIEKSTELHNGGDQLANSDENIFETETVKDLNENAKDAQDSEHASISDEKWQLHLDLSDSASTSDNEVSEMDSSEKTGQNVQKEGNNTVLKDSDTEDFQGFEADMPTSESNGMVLSRLIGFAESSLRTVKTDGASTSRDDFSQYSYDVSPDVLTDDEDNEMDIDECEDVRFTITMIPNPDLREDMTSKDTSSMDVDFTEEKKSNSETTVKMDSENDLNSEQREKKKKVKEKVVNLQNVEASLSEDPTPADSNVAKTPVLNDESVEATSSADASKSKPQSRSGIVSEEISEISSAASSPSISSRSSLKTSTFSGSSTGKHSRGGSPALSASGGRGKKISVDISNPAFLKPFELGWKRELVFRNTNETSFKKMADIYYYTPAGKKVRSNREVLEHLDGIELTLENFTFFKEAIGLNDPSKEIIRDAKKILAKDPNSTPSKKIVKPKTFTPRTPKSSPPTSEATGVSPVSSPLTQTPKAPQVSRTVPPKTFPKIKVSTVRLQKLPILKPILSKLKKESSTEGDMEIGMLPPKWNPSDTPFLKKTPTNAQEVTTTSSWSSPVSQAKDNTEPNNNKGKRKLSGRDSDGPTAKRLKSTSTTTTTPSQESSSESNRHFMQHFMMNMCAGYSSLLHVFQYLKVQELLRAARVCRMWRDMASHPSLWRTVRMKNSHVGDWDGLVKSLQTHETQHLDLRKMIIPSEDTHAMWDEFCRTIVRATSLSRIDLCRCPARVVERVSEYCQLKIINALAIRCQSISLQPITHQKNLQELRLKSQTGIHLTNTLAPLKQMSSLKHLSLTTFKELGKMDPHILGSLKNLESLELGECCDFPEEFGPDSLSKLKKLERLRLEKGQGTKCPTFSILAGIATLPKLTHLELVNFDVKPGFDKALAQCTNIKRLLIIPTYVTQSATTNHMVLNGVNQLCDSLTHFVWGVTHELLRVTELFVDQCEGQKDSKTTSNKPGKKSSGSDSIPILKPIQLPVHLKNDPESKKLSDQENDMEADKSDKDGDAEEKSDKEDEMDEAKATAAAPQVEILPLPKLQRLLTSSLPKTKVKILKIPFHATWRQTISDLAA